MIEAPAAARAATTTVASLYVLCAAAYAVAPQATASFFGLIFHGMDPAMLMARDITFGKFFLGLVVISALTYGIVLFYASLYNRWSRR